MVLKNSMDLINQVRTIKNYFEISQTSHSQNGRVSQFLELHRLYMMHHSIKVVYFILQLHEEEEGSIFDMANFSFIRLKSRQHICIESANAGDAALTIENWS